MYQHFSETGASVNEAYEKVRIKFGAKAQVMNTRTVFTGGFLGFFQKEEVEVTGVIKHDYLAGEKAKLEEEKKKIIALSAQKAEAKKEDETLKEVLAEMKSLKTQLAAIPQGTSSEHPTLEKLQEIFRMNDFSRDYSAHLLSKIRQEFSLENLEDFFQVERRTLEWIRSSLEFYSHTPGAKPRIFVLVGPTGVGKTTTIAKLAAIFGGLTGMDENRKVAMITIDNYRIGAKVQIEKYGEIMGFPVTGVEGFDELRDRISSLRGFDYILIDTIGKSPKDFMKLAEMRSLLDAAGKGAEVHLALSATTKTSDLKEIMAQFEPFQYKSVVITKMDETSQPGNLLSLLWEKGKPLSFVTNGQGVPQDIRKAEAKIFMDNLMGFSEENIKSILEVK